MSAELSKELSSDSCQAGGAVEARRAAWTVTCRPVRKPSFLANPLFEWIEDARGQLIVRCQIVRVGRMKEDVSLKEGGLKLLKINFLQERIKFSRAAVLRLLPPCCRLDQKQQGRANNPTARVTLRCQRKPKSAVDPSAGPFRDQASKTSDQLQTT